MTDPQQILKQYFGFTQFRPLQKQIINQVLANQDVFVLMPTGGGKSLCYQLPAIAKSGLTLVVSPLIALMKDQVDNLRQNGISAAFYNSSLDTSQKSKIEQGLIDQKLTLLYVAPERLMQVDFLNFLKSLNVSLIAIDEAHCISEWGHDFRPEYRQLSTLKTHFPQTPIIALTATATPRVRDDIINQLHLQNGHSFQASFNRTNLSYRIIPKHKPLDQVIDYVRTHPNQSGIVYCQSRASVDKMSANLNAAGLKSLPYHAGLTDEQRRLHQDRFIKDDVDIIVATIAFGMGIDKPNVRFVIHADLPSNIERYYQETGRAGRDGINSECVLLFSPGDIQKIRHFINQKIDYTEQQIASKQLKQMMQFAQSSKCRRYELLTYFGEKYSIDNCQNCDNCLTPQATFDATEISQKILSCVYRVGQRFGTKHIASVLTGKDTPNILQNNHDHLSTYGIVKNYSVRDLQNLMQQLIQEGYLLQTDGEYPILKLTDKSLTVLKDNQPVFLTQITTIADKPDKQIKLKSSDLSSKMDHDLFQRLRQLRKQLADSQNVPPYVIFPDTALQEMATFQPKTKSDFAKIRGVGEQKLESYAEAFLAEINNSLS